MNKPEVHCYLCENPIAPWAEMILPGLWWRCEELSFHYGKPYQTNYWVKVEEE